MWKRTTESFEQGSAQAKSSVRMIRKTLLACLILQILTNLLIIGHYVFEHGSEIKGALNPVNPYIPELREPAEWEIKSFYSSFVLYPFGLSLVLFYHNRRGKKLEKGETVEGFELLKPRSWKKQARPVFSDFKKDPFINHAKGVDIPLSLSYRGELVNGASGVGKSIYLLRLARQFNELGIPCLFYDNGCALLPLFWKPGDKIVNLYDERTSSIPLSEIIRDELSLAAAAQSIFPVGIDETAQHFNATGAGVFMGLCRVCKEKGFRLSYRSILGILREDAGIIKTLLKDIRDNAHKYYNIPGIGEAALTVTTEGVETTLSRHLTGWELLDKAQDKAQFSHLDWLKSGTENIFLSTTKKGATQQRYPFAFYLDSILTEALDIPESQARPIAVFVDEINTLPKIQSIGAANFETRKRKIIVKIGGQSIRQIADIYGEAQTDALVDSCSLTATFRVKSGKTAQYMSDYLTDAEVRSHDKSLGISEGKETRDSAQHSSRKSSQAVASKRTIQTLPDYTAIFSVSSLPPVISQTKDEKFCANIEPFIMSSSYNFTGNHSTFKTLKSTSDISPNQVRSPKNAGKYLKFVGAVLDVLFEMILPEIHEKYINPKPTKKEVK